MYIDRRGTCGRPTGKVSYSQNCVVGGETAFKDRSFDRLRG